MAFKSIQVVAAKVAGSETNFPVLIKPSVISNFGSISLAQAQSIRVYSDEAKTTELAREIVSADVIYVLVPSFTSTTTIYIDYDGVRSDYAASATYGAQAVWVDYAGVWHMNSVNDSTANGYNMTANGGVSVGGATGKIGSATEFDGANDSFSVTGATLLEPDTSDFTAQFWANIQGEPATRHPVLWKGEDTGSGYGTDWWHVEYDFGDDGKMGFCLDDASQFDALRGADITTGYTLSAWQLHHMERDASSGMFAYQNGSGNGSNALTQGDVSPTGTFYIGRNYNGDYAPVIVEEVRIRRSLLGSNWISTEYQCMNDNGAFWQTAVDIGAAETQNSNFFSIL